MPCHAIPAGVDPPAVPRDDPPQVPSSTHACHTQQVLHVPGPCGQNVVELAEAALFFQVRLPPEDLNLAKHVIKDYIARKPPDHTAHANIHVS